MAVDKYLQALLDAPLADPIKLNLVGKGRVIKRGTMSVDKALIGDFIRAIASHDIGTARCIVHRLFANSDDAAVADSALAEIGR